MAAVHRLHVGQRREADDDGGLDRWWQRGVLVGCADEMGRHHAQRGLLEDLAWLSAPV